MKVKLNILHRTVITIDIQNHFKIMSKCIHVLWYSNIWFTLENTISIFQNEEIRTNVFNFLLLPTSAENHVAFVISPHYRDCCVNMIYLYLLSVQGWVCAAIGCLQCTAVFLSSSSICLIAVDRWESCELGLHWWPGAWFSAIINFQQLLELRQTFRSF